MTDTSRLAGRPLLRRREDRVLRGVCAAVGSATDTDPVLWRVCIAVLTLFGGTGLLLYVVGWVIIPEEGAAGSIAERRLRRLERARPAVVALVVGAAALVALFTLDTSGVAPLAVFAVLALLVLRRTGAAPALPTADAPSPPIAAAQRRRRAGGAVFLLVAGAALLAVGVLSVLGATGVVHVTLGRALALALLVVGAGQLATLRLGRSGALLALEVTLALALGGTVLAGVDPPLSAGDRSWPVSASAERSLGAGDATLDLRPLRDTTGPAKVTARVGLGNLRVELPDTLHAELVFRVGAGQLVLPDGAGTVNGTRIRESRTYGPADRPLVRIDVHLGAGNVEVHRAAS